MNPDIEEIRINESYVSKLQSDYAQGGTKNESTPVIRMNHVRTDQYIQKMLNSLNVTTENIVIPQNCRFIKTHSVRSIAIIEEPPAIRSIRVEMDMSRDMESLKGKGKWEEFGYEKFFNENKSPYTFMLAMPYVIHVLYFNRDKRFSSGRVFFRPKPLLGLADQLYVAPLLNISSDMSVCYGDEIYNDSPRAGLNREIEHAVKVFWSAPFNTDYIENYYAYEGIAGVCDYFTWQYYSQTNPMFIYNVDWKPHKNNLDHYITTYDQYINKEHNNIFGYRTLANLFNKSTVSEKLVEVGKRKIRRNLIYDICNGWMPEGNLAVYIGDPLNYSKGRIAFIDCFMGVKGRSEPLFIRLQVDGKFISLKNNPKVRQFIADKIKELRYEAGIELKDGTIISSGDIISTKNLFGNETFKKIHYIRKAHDERVEMRIGSEYWFVDTFNWDNVKKADLETPVIDGVTLDKKKVYKFLSMPYNPPSPFGKFSNVKFTEITTGMSGSLVAKFKETEEAMSVYTINFSKNSEARKIYPPDELEDMPEIFFIGRRIISVKNNYGSQTTAKRHKEFGVMISKYDSVDTRFNIKYVAGKLISEDMNHFHIESNNMNIDFSVGDKVVVADWDNPLEILRIKTIESFMVDEDNHTISFALRDKQENLSTVPYIKGRDGAILTGKIRKVTQELNEITVGTKIIAKEARISCFPKKDVNIIVAFIIDTGGEPLVLCSNGCTLWFSDVFEKFDHISKKSKRWKTLQHANLQPTKIKLQAGDIINGSEYYRRSHGYFISKAPTASAGMRTVKFSSYHENDEYQSTDKYFFNDIKLDCIPNPRMNPQAQSTKGFVMGFPNFHGGISVTEQNHSPYKMIDESGRF